MDITEVRIKLAEENNERLLAFCSITFENAFVIHDLKILEGDQGLFISMPSRKLMDHCRHCNRRNHLRARYCNNCGVKLDENRATSDADDRAECGPRGRPKLYTDIVHPINSACRKIIQNAVLRAYHKEKERSKQPGYVPNSLL